jgi:hypothetical protein
MMEPVSVFFGEISPNFYLKNIISTYAKDFSWKKWIKFTRFQRKTNPNWQAFMINSSR